jgi:hypothetical protein
LDERGGGHVEAADKPARSDAPLFGKPYESFPPVNAVFLLGSGAIGDYLKSHRWPRNEPLNSNFPDPVPREYEKFWQTNCPVYQSDLVAALGGWHFPWPEGDWYDLVDREFVCWTLHDSEPWVEVFREGDDYTVYQRAT